MYEEGIRTPLILRLPWVKRGAPTQEALVTLMDICPTILELAGVEVPRAVEGRSLSGLYQGQTQPDRNAVFAGFASHKTPSYHRMVTRCVRTRQYKFIQHLLTGEMELFDLSQDPLEMNNLAGEKAYAQIEEKLRGQLMQWRHQYPDR